MQLSVVTLGHVHADALAALTPHVTRLEQLVLDIPPRAALADHRAELNRAVDAASADWVLVVRERETIDDALAREIAEAARAARAWGFRVRTIPYYAGRPLRIGGGEGELRLFHRRHLLRRGEPAVQGTVVWLENAFRAVTFESAEAHLEYLEKTAVPHSRIRRLLLFLRYALSARTLDGTTLRYLWNEAAFDSGRS